jgi:cellulose synthase (UDP-forming)
VINTPTHPVSDTPAVKLPAAPTDATKFSYVKRHMWLLNTFSIVAFACVSISAVRFSLMTDTTFAYLAVIALAALGVVISLQANINSPDFDQTAHQELVSAWQPAGDGAPSVDVFLPISGEDHRVLSNTWEHVLALDYPNLTVYVLDDSPDDSARPLAQEFGFTYLRRENRGWYKKAGNLRYGYESSTGDYILVLDADFCPRPDFLRETLPYLEADPQLGIVQTPQYFATHDRQNWLERGACAVQELFYRVVQVSRENLGGAICVGTCAVYRRAALDSNGGTTLIEHSEDVHTGFDLRRNGWRLQYIPVCLASGLCPDDLSGFFRQQYRWCMGSLSLCTSAKFWQTRMSLRTRLCYVSGFFYYGLTALAVATGPIMPLALLIFFPHHIHAANYLLLTPALIWTYLIMRLWHHSDFRLETLSTKLVYGWAHTFAFIDLLRGKPMGWSATGAKVKNNRVRNFRVAITVWGGGSALTMIFLCFYRMFEGGYSPVQFLPLLVLSCLYSATNARIVLFGAGEKLSSLIPVRPSAVLAPAHDTAFAFAAGLERALERDGASLSVAE